MTLEEVRAGIELIRSKADDDEVAHGLEDDLRHEVLEAIANGAENARELAAELLKTSDIKFSRWTA